MFILADDLGFGDVPWNNEYLATKMPNLGEVKWGQLSLKVISGQLRTESTEIKRNYMYPTCTPSRAALLTGRNAEKLGQAHFQVAKDH